MLRITALFHIKMLIVGDEPITYIFDKHTTRLYKRIIVSSIQNTAGYGGGSCNCTMIIGIVCIDLLADRLCAITTVRCMQIRNE